MPDQLDDVLLACLRVLLEVDLVHDVEVHTHLDLLFVTIYAYPVLIHTLCDDTQVVGPRRLLGTVQDYVVWAQDSNIGIVLVSNSSGGQEVDLVFLVRVVGGELQAGLVLREIQDESVAEGSQ